METILTSITLLSLGLAGSVVGAEKAVDRLFYANDFPAFCQAGTKQSPINVPADVEELGEHLRPQLTFPTVLHPSVTDDGHGFKVTWNEPHDGQLPKLVAGGSGLSDILLDPSIDADLSIEMEPIQFHVHFPAEHTVDGKLFAGELHIVSLVSRGSAPADWGCDEYWQDPEHNDPNFSKCAAVFGVLFELGDSTPEYLMDLLDSAPTSAHETASLDGSQSIDLQSLLPTSLSHYTYFGSLTTPPCVEGVRWHFFKTPVPIAAKAVEMAQTKLANTRIKSDDGEVLGYRTNNRFTQPLNGRTVFVANDGKHHSGHQSGHHSKARKLGEDYPTLHHSKARKLGEGYPPLHHSKARKLGEDYPELHHSEARKQGEDYPTFHHSKARKLGEDYPTFHD